MSRGFMINGVANRELKLNGTVAVIVGQAEFVGRVSGEAA